MSLKLAFWIIILVLVLFFGAGVFGISPYATRGFSLVEIVLFVILGIAAFGKPIQG